MERMRTKYVEDGRILQNTAFTEYRGFKPLLDSAYIQLEQQNKDRKDLKDLKQQYDKLLLENKKLHEDLRRNQHNLKATRNAAVSCVENYESKGDFFLNRASQMLAVKNSYVSAHEEFVLHVENMGKEVDCGFDTFADKETPENNFWSYYESQLKKCKQIKEAVEAASQVQQDLEDLRSTFAESSFQHQADNQVERVVDSFSTHDPTAGIVEEHGGQNSRHHQLPPIQADAEAVDVAPQVQEELEDLRSTFAESSFQHQADNQVERVVDSSSTHAPTAGIVEERGYQQNSRRGQPPLQADATNSPRRLWMGGYPNTPLAAIREGADMELEYTSSKEGESPLFGMNILEREGPSGGYTSPTSTEASISHYDQETNPVADAFFNQDACEDDEANNAPFEQVWKQKFQDSEQGNKCMIDGCAKDFMACLDHWKKEREVHPKHKKTYCYVLECTGRILLASSCRCPKHFGPKGKYQQCSVNLCTTFATNGNTVDGRFCPNHWKERQHPSISAGENATGTIGFNSSADGQNRKQCSMYGYKSAAKLKSKHGLPGRFCLTCSELKPTGNSGVSISADENADPQHQ